MIIVIFENELEKYMMIRGDYKWISYGFLNFLKIHI